MSDIAIDHVFVLRKHGDPLPPAVREHRLTEQYRREHPGQGTANVCFAFDNFYLELLWIHDVTEAASTGIRRIGLLERSRWMTDGGCPFGIAWRGGDEGRTLAVPCWDFRPPYLPPDRAIRVAVDSDDTRQPMLFESPGHSSPLEWPSERRGTLQHDSDLGSVTRITLTLANRTLPAAALAQLAENSILTVIQGTRPALELAVTRRSNDSSERIRIEPS